MRVRNAADMDFDVNELGGYTRKMAGERFKQHAHDHTARPIETHPERYKRSTSKTGQARRTQFLSEDLQRVKKKACSA